MFGWLLFGLVATLLILVVVGWKFPEARKRLAWAGAALAGFGASLLLAAQQWLSGIGGAPPT